MEEMVTVPKKCLVEFLDAFEQYKKDVDSLKRVIRMMVPGPSSPAFS